MLFFTSPTDSTGWKSPLWTQQAIFEATKIFNNPDRSWADKHDLLSKILQVRLGDPSAEEMILAQKDRNYSPLLAFDTKHPIEKEEKQKKVNMATSYTEEKKNKVRQ